MKGNYFLVLEEIADIVLSYHNQHHHSQIYSAHHYLAVDQFAGRLDTKNGSPVNIANALKIKILGAKRSR